MRTPERPPLVPLSRVAGRPLEWVWRGVVLDRYQLVATDGEVVAALRRRRFFGLTWDAETAEEAWEIRHRGFLFTRAEISAATPSGLSGVLHRRLLLPERIELSGGGRYELRQGLPFRRAWILSGYRDTELIRFLPGLLRRRRIEVEVAASAWGLPELGLLLVLGCQQIVWRRRAARAS